MGLYLGGLIMGGMFVSKMWGAYLFIYLFLGWGWGGGGGGGTFLQNFKVIF